MSRASEFLRNLAAGRADSATGEINLKTWRADRSAANYYIAEYALFTVIDFIATLMTSVEWRTIYNGKEERKAEWYRLNVKPNINQSAPELWHEFWCRLLLDRKALAVGVNDQILVADSFQRQPYAMLADRFDRVTVCPDNPLTFERPFWGNQEIYLEYSPLPVAAMANRMMALYADMIQQSTEAHKTEGGERGVLNVGMAARGPEDFEQKYGEWINKRFKGYFKGRNAVMPLFNGMSYQKTSGQSAHNRASEVSQMAKDAIATAARAYKVAPALMLGEVAGFADAVEMTLTGCIDPLANMLAAELTGKTFTQEEVLAGCRVQAFTANIKHVDLFANAANFDKLISNGWSHEELRYMLGLPVPDGEWATTHYITKNYANAEGGEEIEA